MPRLPLLLPEPGESQVADDIRQRRQPRGLIALDGILLHNPSIANGWNSLFGAIREKNSLPDELRELLILRVAALNSAPYEWIQHEKVGRAAGLTTPQLWRIRDTTKPLDHPGHASLSNLLLAGLAFTDSLTREIQVRDSTFEEFKNQLGKSGREAQVDTMLLDATATVAGYNMVSRMLVGLEIGDDRNHSVELPGLQTRFEKLIMSDQTQLTIRHQFLDNRPTLMFCNSLLTNMAMWDWILPSLAPKYNLICFDQRGHGQSAVPTSPCTMAQLAGDICEIVKQLGLSTPLHGLIGVSQGGATVLEVSTQYPHLFKRYVVCDTQPHSSSGARDTWDKRIKLAGDGEDGPRRLSESTITRWFPIESHLNQPHNQISTCIRRMIEETSVEGFKLGAAALCDYKIDESLIPFNDQHKVLLVSGENDVMLRKALKEFSERLHLVAGKMIQHITITGAGHLPMVDQPLKFLKVIEPFLDD